MGLLRKKTNHGHRVRDQLQFERDIEHAHRNGKAKIHGFPNKKRTIVVKFLNKANKKFYPSTRHESYGPKVSL